MMGLLMLSACNGDATAWRDMPGYREVRAEKEAEQRRLAALFAEDDRRTICGDEIAMELEPELDELLDVAVSYWEQEGYTDITTGGDYECDIPVVFLAEGDPRMDWPHDGASAAADPKTNHLFIRESHWPKMKAEGWRKIVLKHEIGHFHLGMDHTEEGLMSPDAGLCELAEEKYGPLPCGEEKRANERT